MATRTRQKQRDEEPDDGLLIPSFLRVDARERARRDEDWRRNPPVPLQAPITSVKRGAYTPSMLADPGTRALIAEMEADKARRLAERAARRDEEKASRPKRINPLAGLIPLKQILAEMGESAPRRRHAMLAIESAGLVHTRFHFEPGEATLARVRRALEQYRPEKKERGARPPEGVIRLLTQTNPKRAGTGGHERFALLMRCDGRTTSEFAAAGGNPRTLLNAVADGRARIDDTKRRKS
jgi:hypothetical protein